jgi:hypothetical protein
MERSMMNERNIPQTYWIEAIHTVFHILNKSHLRLHSDKTPYEVWFGRSASIKHFKIFGSKFYIKNNDENIGKYDDRADEGILLGYACYTSKLLTLIVSQVSSLQRSQVSHFAHKVASVACCSQVSQTSNKAYCHDAYVVPITT